MAALQKLLDAIYPPACIACGGAIAGGDGLCGPCWRDADFLSGARCRYCAQRVDGAETDVERVCEDCRSHARPWEDGAAVFAYSGTGRRLVLALKHGDRLDSVPQLARWMARAATARDLDRPVFVPVPAHRWRLMRRRYNQAAVLAQAVAYRLGADYAPFALERRTSTAPLDGVGRDERFGRLEGAIQPAAGARAEVLRDRHVVIVDDVMTSGATLAATADAAHAAGAYRISVLMLARAEKET